MQSGKEVLSLRVLVCGSRHYKDSEKVHFFIKRMGISLLIVGGCRGADWLAVQAAQVYGIPFVEYPADWGRYGRAAGPIRNEKMLREGRPEFVLAFHENIRESRGTLDMLSRARRADIPFEVIS